MNDTLRLLDDALPRTVKWLALSDVPEPRSLVDLDIPPSFGCCVQVGGDLGGRLGNMFERAFSCGAVRVVIMGSDSPTLPQHAIHAAFDELERADVALGPAEDGGYYLIGCRTYDPRLFDAVEWSTSRTFQQTQANAKRIGYSTAVLETWFDLDTWSDVERMLARAGRHPLPFHTAAVLESLGGGAT